MPTYQPNIPLVIIVDPDEAEMNATRRMLIESEQAQVVGTAREREGIGHLMSADPDIVLLAVGNDLEDIGPAVHEIHDYSPRCQVILLQSPDSTLDLGRAMRAGARGVVRKPISAVELVNTIHEVFSAEQARVRRIEEVAKQRATQGRAGEVITVFSSKGGVGCTAIASNLAIALADITKAKVALVDYNLQFGDVAVLLNLQSTHGVHELMRSVDDLDNAILEDVMVLHPSGVRVLLPPATLDQVEDVDTEGMVAIIKALRKYYDYVVIDTWHSIEETTLALMDMSSILLLITTPEVPALRNTRRLLDMVRERADLRGKVRIVANRYPSKSAVSMKDIELSLGATPIATIPSDGQLVTAAINEGVSFVSKRSPAAKGVLDLANVLAQPRMMRQNRAAAPDTANNANARRTTGPLGRAKTSGKTP